MNIATLLSTAPATLPPHFTGPWKVDAKRSTSGTGFDVDDKIDIGPNGELKITLTKPTSRMPDPLLLQNLTLTAVSAAGAADPNDLTAQEAADLCKVIPGEFMDAFLALLRTRSFKMTYLAAAGGLGSTHPHVMQLIFLPYVVDGDASTLQFVLAVLDTGAAANHNGIVHGSP